MSWVCEDGSVSEVLFPPSLVDNFNAYSFSKSNLSSSFGIFNTVVSVSTWLGGRGVTPRSTFEIN